MLDKKIRILNFDNSLLGQGRLLEKYPAQIIDLTAYATGCRLYGGKKLRDKISALIPAPFNGPVFTGSGDFHHISSILTSRINEPAALIVFDFHPDFDGMPPAWGCGSWVRQALKNKNITKCILLGAGSADLDAASLFTASLGLLSCGRLEIYPYRHKKSRVFLRRVPATRCLRQEKKVFFTDIIWKELEGEDPEKFAAGLVKDLGLSRAYISIDKDCLSGGYALTNWEEGLMGLDKLLAILKVLQKNLDIAGLDITGEYSPCLFASSLKAGISRLDHPKKFSALKRTPEEILKINQETNLAILGQLFP